MYLKVGIIQSRRRSKSRVRGLPSVRVRVRDNHLGQCLLNADGLLGYGAARDLFHDVGQRLRKLGQDEVMVAFLLDSLWQQLQSVGPGGGCLFANPNVGKPHSPENIAAQQASRQESKALRLAAFRLKG